MRKEGKKRPWQEKNHTDSGWFLHHLLTDLQRTDVHIHTPSWATFLLHVFITLILGFGEAYACYFHNSYDSAEGEEMWNWKKGKVIWRASDCSSVTITALKSCEILLYLSQRWQTSTFHRVIGKIRALGFKGLCCRYVRRGELAGHMTWTGGRASEETKLHHVHLTAVKSSKLYSNLHRLQACKSFPAASTSRLWSWSSDSESFHLVSEYL